LERCAAVAESCDMPGVCAWACACAPAPNVTSRSTGDSPRDSVGDSLRDSLNAEATNGRIDMTGSEGG